MRVTAGSTVFGYMVPHKQQGAALSLGGSNEVRHGVDEPGSAALARKMKMACSVPCNCSQSGSQLRARRSTSSSGESTAKEGSP